MPGRIPLVINSLGLGRRSLGEVDFIKAAAEDAENVMSRASNALTQAGRTEQLASVTGVPDAPVPYVT